MNKLPFSGLSGELGFINAILNKNIPAPKISSKWSNEYRDLVSKCLDKNKDNRIKIDQVISHPFLKNAENLKQKWAEELARCKAEHGDLNDIFNN